MPRGYKEQLKLIRPLTGGFFGASRGYALNRQPNFGQRMAVLKYARVVEELISVPVEIYSPKNAAELLDVLEETGQRKGFKRFKKAIVPKPPTPDDVDYSYDKKRPKGSRLVATSRKTGRRYYHIPADEFLDYDVSVDNEEFDTSVYEDIIREYAPDAEFFLIQAGESYMWGSALGDGGSLEGVADKIGQIFRNYSASMFDANDKNSSYIGNWFRGVTAFTSRYDAVERMRDALIRQAEFRNKFRTTKERFRVTRDGQVRRFEDGVLWQGHHRLKGNLWGEFVDGIMVGKYFKEE